MRPLAWLVLACAACGTSTAPNPFPAASAGGAGAGGAGEAGGAGAANDGGAAGASVLGGPCARDAQCDDAVDCTFDVCDLEVGRCRFHPDHSVCADDVYCNGVERCDPVRGCGPGEPVTCADGSTCTIHRCVESEHSCESLPRDADGDGDPDLACGSGGDCNDADPRVSSLSVELCDNQRDDDCDGSVDEADCEEPEHDTCADPLLVEGSGTYEVAMAAAAGDYAASCAGSDEGWQDAVVAVTIGSTLADVDIVATVATGQLALAAGVVCGDAASELECHEAVQPPGGGRLARLRLRSVGLGSHPVYLFGKSLDSVTLEVALLPPTTEPGNETCGTAEPLAPGVATTASLSDAAPDSIGACAAETGDLFYRFTLAAAQDVMVHAESTDGWGRPVLSLRGPQCSGAEDELTCRAADPADLFARALAPGTYFLGVAATAPTDVEFTLHLLPPSPPPADESCASPPRLPLNTTIDVPLDGHADDVHVGCLPGAADAVYALELDQRSDVRLVQRISAGDTGGISLAWPPCDTDGSALACGTSAQSPARVGAHDLEPGSYRVVSETAEGNPTQVTALVRPAVAPVLVAFADSCADAVEIGPTGGTFQGNTVNATHDHEAGCDAGGRTTDPSPDQMLHLSLTERRRVVLDMQGSGYRTLLDVRRGPSCPGIEVTEACSVGFSADRSYLDLVLDPGDYYVQIDGYSGQAGPWILDVFVVPQ